jgi:hypothetical protein
MNLNRLLIALIIIQLYFIILYSFPRYELPRPGYHVSKIIIYQGKNGEWYYKRFKKKFF